MPQVVLKSGRDKSVRNRHPRLFAGGIKQVDGKPKEGDVVDVLDNKGEWLARGIINQQAQIAVRLLTWDADETIDDAFWHQRVAAAVHRRNIDPLLRETNARRVIFSESDGLPGVIADDYAGHIVLQTSTLAASRARPVVTDALVQLLQPVCIVERNDEERLKHEHVQQSGGILYGAIPTGPVTITEHNEHFQVHLAGGQKTGFYLDQRPNRRIVQRYVTPGSRVLNCFSYTGAFGVAAAIAGAQQIINVDSSADALALARQNFALNQIDTNAANIDAGHPERVSFVCDDAFDDLRRRRARGEQFDVVILDPPKFAHNINQVDKAARAYKDMNRVGLALVKPGGVLATFSCSGVISAELLQKVIFSASIEAHRDGQILERLTQASDHPVLLSYPESEYLKGLIVRVY